MKISSPGGQSKQKSSGFGNSSDIASLPFTPFFPGNPSAPGSPSGPGGPMMPGSPILHEQLPEFSNSTPAEAAEFVIPIDSRLARPELRAS